MPQLQRAAGQSFVEARGLFNDLFGTVAECGSKQRR
jgi:hypothetical protein